MNKYIPHAAWLLSVHVFLASSSMASLPAKKNPSASESGTRLAQQVVEAWQQIGDSASAAQEIRTLFPGIQSGLDQAREAYTGAENGILQAQQRLQGQKDQRESLSKEVAEAEKTFADLKESYARTMKEWEALNARLPLGKARLAFADETLAATRAFIQEKRIPKGSYGRRMFEYAERDYLNARGRLEQAQNGFRRQRQFLLLIEPQLTRASTWIASLNQGLKTTAQQIEKAQAKLTPVSEGLKALQGQFNIERDRLSALQKELHQVSITIRELYFKLLVFETETLGQGETRDIVIDVPLPELPQAFFEASAQAAPSYDGQRYYAKNMGHTVGSSADGYYGAPAPSAAPSEPVPEEITMAIQILEAVSGQLTRLASYLEETTSAGERFGDRVSDHIEDLSGQQRTLSRLTSELDNITSESSLLADELALQKAQFQLVSGQSKAEIEGASARLKTLNDKVSKASGSVEALLATPASKPAQ